MSLLALLFERHGELAVGVRAGRGLGGDAPVDERRERRRDVVVRHGGALRAESGEGRAGAAAGGGGKIVDRDFI